MNLNMPLTFQLVSTVVEEAVQVAHSEGTHLKAGGSPPVGPIPDFNREFRALSVRVLPRLRANRAGSQVSPA